MNTEATDQDIDIDAAIEAMGDDASERLVRAFEAWNKTRDYKREEGKRLREKLNGRIALFAEAMNVGHSNTGDQVLKLSVVEQRWQDLEETRAEKRDVLGALTDQVKAQEQKIRDLITEARSSQLSLFESPPEDGGDAGVDDDAGQ